MNAIHPHPRRVRGRRDDGFTLIELMVTVAVIAILAAVAYPAYTDSVWKAKRGEAKAAIARGLQAEERYYTQNNTYGTAPTVGFPPYSADSLATSRYQVEGTNAFGNLCPSAGSYTQCVVVRATVIGTPDPLCGAWIAMDSMGNRDVATTANKDKCWTR